MFFVYILESETKHTYYIGCTDNINRRILEHNTGLSKYTKREKPWTLKYREEFDSLKEARNRELQIKSWKKRKAIEKLIRARFV